MKNLLINFVLLIIDFYWYGFLFMAALPFVLISIALKYVNKISSSGDVILTHKCTKNQNQLFN